jgi:MSHA biogenesis protein MshL
MSSKTYRPLFAILGAVTLAVSAAFGQTRAEINEILDKPVDEFNVPAPGKPAGEVFDGLATTFRIPVIIDPMISGNVAFRVYGTHLRGLLDAICSPHGWHYEIQGEDGSAYLSIQRFITRSYSIDYPQADQTSTSNASVSLSGGQGGTSGPNGTTQSAVQTTTTGAYGQNGTATGSSGGSSSVNMTTNSKQDFWDRFEKDAAKYIQPDELLIVNRMGGNVQLTASLKTHALLQDYIDRLMARVRRHAFITIHTIRVDLTNQGAVGVDIAAAQQQINGIGDSVTRIGGTFAPVALAGGTPYSPVSGTGTVTGAGSGFGSIGNVALSSPTVQTVIGVGKVSALVTALKKQGNVVVGDTTMAATLNNQMALIQVTQDMPFFSRANSTNFNPGGTTITGVPPVESSNFTEQTVSFGSVLEVTPQISDDLVCTVVVAPTITEFLGTITSGDNLSTAPNTGTRRFRSTYVLRNHQSAIISTFMESTKGKTRAGVPGLSSIPFLGAAFRTDTTLDNRSEFIIIMTVDAEDGSVPPPKTIEMPLADQARNYLGRDISPDMTRELTDEQKPSLQEATAHTQPAPPPAPPAPPATHQVELIGAGAN